MSVVTHYSTRKIHAKKFLFIPSRQFNFSSVLNYQSARPFLRISSVKTASEIAREISFPNLTQKHRCSVFTPFHSLRSFYQVCAPLQHKRVWITVLSIFARMRHPPREIIVRIFSKSTPYVISTLIFNRRKQKPPRRIRSQYDILLISPLNYVRGQPST